MMGRSRRLRSVSSRRPGSAGTTPVVRRVPQCCRRGCDERNGRITANAKSRKTGHHRRVSIVLRNLCVKQRAAAGCLAGRIDEGIHRHISCSLKRVVAAVTDIAMPVVEDIGEAVGEALIEVVQQVSWNLAWSVVVIDKFRDQNRSRRHFGVSDSTNTRRGARVLKII